MGEGESWDRNRGSVRASLRVEARWVIHGSGILRDSTALESGEKQRSQYSPSPASRAQREEVLDAVQYSDVRKR